MSADLVSVVLIAFASGVAIAFGVARYRPARRWPWVLLAAAVTLHAAATLLDATRQAVDAGDATVIASLNAGHVLSSLLGFAALRELLFRGAPEHDRERVVDAAIVSLALGLVVWAIGYERGSAPVDIQATGALVMLGQVVVFGAILHISFSGLLALPAARWLAATIVIGQIGSVWAFVGPVDAQALGSVLWAMAMACPGLAGLSPSMRDLSAPSRTIRGRRPVSARARMTLLGAGLVAVPVAMLLRDTTSFWPQRVLSVGLVVTSVAAAWRMLGLVGQRDAAAAELERANVELEQLAGEDALTGLPNRRRFQQVLREAVTTRHPVAVLLIDLDRFKLINDGIGHAAGDELLVAVAQRLRSAVRAGDTPARLGGDEFAIVCPDVGSEHDADEIADRIAHALNGVYVLDQHRYHVTGSVGVAVAAAPDISAAELLRNADIAMYQAKQRGRARVERYNHAVDDRSARRLALTNALPEALERNELVIMYQPEVDLTEGTTLWAEALLRWRHPTEGLLPPDAFLGLAEDTGAIVPFGHWVLRQVCAQMAWWREHHPASAPTTVAVNVSSRQLADPQLIGTIRQALADAALDPRMLWLEITETSVLQDPELVAETLAELKRLGVGVALDDFGTGYSSLAYLKRFPIDALKIDRSFVAGMSREPQDRKIVSAVVSLAHALGLLAVAEGVETAEQLAELRHLRCDFAQGYLWTRPLEPDDFTSWMNDHDRRALARTGQA